MKIQLVQEQQQDSCCTTEDKAEEEKDVMVYARELKKTLGKQGYYLAGDHSAVKICHWTKSSLRNRNYCYKERFYGMESHRCLQMTPNIAYCQHKCLYCWRPFNFDSHLDEGQDEFRWEKADVVVDKCIEGQRKLLEGYYGSLDKVSKKVLDDAQNPTNAAISLTGEPTVYPYMPELIEEFHKRGMTTYLVTNGMVPQALEKMRDSGKMPTHLYLSLDSPNEDIFLRLDNPKVPNAWETLMKTVELWPTMTGSRRDIRVTCVKGWNMDMKHAEEFAEMLLKTETDFVEVKAYMWVGASQERLEQWNMPLHDDVLEYAKEIVKHMPGYFIKDQFRPSRVVLIAKGKGLPKLEVHKENRKRTASYKKEFVGNEMDVDDYLTPACDGC